MTDRRRVESGRPTGTFVLELRLDAEGPVRGSIRSHRAADAATFTGWVELMVAGRTAALVPGGRRPWPGPLTAS